MWKEIEGPFTKVLADTIRDCGMMVIVHNCGNGLYFDAQIEMMDPIAISCAYPPDDCADWQEIPGKKEKFHLMFRDPIHWVFHYKIRLI